MNSGLFDRSRRRELAGRLPFRRSANHPRNPPKRSKPPMAKRNRPEPPANTTGKLPTGLTTLRVLSVQQPYADAILSTRPDRKVFELRTWTTPYRGPLWIHASRRAPDYAEMTEYMPTYGTGQVGVILGVVDLTMIFDAGTIKSIRRVRRGGKLPDESLRDIHNWVCDNRDAVDQWISPIDFHWVTTNPRLLREPIQTGGKLNVWKLEVDPRRLTFRE
jgi:hypothetical protein